MSNRPSTAAKVAERKRRRPELYCPNARCLWMTGGGACPRHGGKPCDNDAGEAPYRDPIANARDEGRG